jgi:plasmid stability protein
VKTNLELPDALVREVKVYAARRGLSFKQVVTDSLRRTLSSNTTVRPSLRALPSLSVGRVLEVPGKSDILDEMLNERGHRY